MSYSMKTALMVTNGGRALTAIWDNQNLSTKEKIFLLYLGSRLDFRSDFTEQRFESLTKICAATGLSRTTALRVANQLEFGRDRDGDDMPHGGGYLRRQQRKEVNGNNLPSLYNLTDKLFKEYADNLESKEEHPPEPTPESKGAQGGTPAEPRVGSHGDSSSFRELPQDSSLNFSAEPSAQKMNSKALKDEALGLTSLVFMPKDDGSGKRRFVSVEALRLTTYRALEEFGIDVLRRMYSVAEDTRQLGRWVFDPNTFRSLCRQIAAQAPAV
jgi:hypothetical protein